MEMSLNENSNPLSLEDFSVCKKLVTGGKCIPQFSNSPLGRFCQLTPHIRYVHGLSCKLKSSNSRQLLRQIKALIHCQGCPAPREGLQVDGHLGRRHQLSYSFFEDLRPQGQFGDGGQGTHHNNIA